jgi:L-lactate dehydrogenase
MDPENKDKIAIIGAGEVGATIAYACLLRGVGKHLLLYDINPQKVDAQCLDLNHGLQFVRMATVQAVHELDACAGADVIVITAGAKQKVGQTRMDLAANNVEICRRIIPALAAVAPNALILMVTNPVDVLTYAAIKLSGWPAGRILGSGTVLDSSRFRFLIAQRCRVAVRNVHATIAGEHGESEIPLWSSASIANIPLHDWAVRNHGRLTVRDRTEIFQNVKEAAQQIIQGKGATNYAIGLATARILEAILNDENSILPVSGLIQNYRGIDEVCLSVPRVVNRSGIEAPLPVPMNVAEESGLQNSAAMIKESIKTLGF